MATRKIDLNLFRVFDAVMQYRSIIAASQELGITASAVSHALARLRQAIGDELFVSGSSGMTPTPRAMELAPNIAAGLAKISDAIETNPFSPVNTLRTFRIAASDNIASTVVPLLVTKLADAAPQVGLKIFPFSRTDVVRQLDEGRLDFVLGWFGDLPERVRRTKVIDEQEAVVVRKGHPLTTGVATKERIFAYPHVVVELLGSEEDVSDGFLDDRGVLRRVWIERLIIESSHHEDSLVARVAVSVPHFSAVPPILAGSELVATLPRRFALRAAEPYGLSLLDLPFTPFAVQVEAVWHHRSDRDSGLQWLLGQLSEAVASA